MTQMNVNIKELQKRSVFIGTPMYGGKCDFIFSKGMNDTAATLAKNDIPFKIHTLANESLIQRARNYITDEFMRSGMTHLLFIDADVGFNPRDVLAMLAYADPQSDYDVLCGPYPKKTISWEKIKHAVDHGFADEDPNKLENYVGDYVFNAKGNTKEIRLDQPVEIMEGGTGFMMIQRKALEKFADTFPQYSYKPDHVRHEHFDGTREIMQYFHCEIDPKSKRYLSEDYWFCQKLQESGVKIWLLPWLELKHQGAYIFGGSLSSLAQIGQNPTADMSVIKKNRKK